ncbi:MAG: M50 family metallopeptidase [Verrucomicrobia bacterium]|nr:M50 family metallopeptidase [Verrucomicrobiota bacterium]
MLKIPILSSLPERTIGCDFKGLSLLLAMFAGAVVFWNSPVLYPVKMFTVLLHECSHGLAAVLTGGTLDRIKLDPDLGGVAQLRGGWRVVTLSAGYLGSMFFGGSIMLLAARTRWDRALSLLLGGLVLAVTLAYVRTPFGFGFGLLFGAALILIGWLAPMAVNDLLLKFLGLTSALYAIVDIKEDLISRTVPNSDAYQLSRILPLPAVVWGVIWIVIALLAALFFLRLSVSRQPGE